MSPRTRHNSICLIELNQSGDAVVVVSVSGPFVEEGEGSELNLIIGLASFSSDNNSCFGAQALSEHPKNIGVNCSSTSIEKKKNIVTREVRLQANSSVTHLMMFLNTSYPIAISFIIYEEPVTRDNQVIGALMILLVVYVLIIFELVHRATAAMVGSLAALSFLSYNNRRPSLETILTWVEWETLSLLFGMMILVAVFAKTGFFDYVALKAYKLSRGHVWGLITLLCACTAVISAVLDNVTVILLLTPVTVTLCQVLNLNPTYILIAEVIFSNIGGTATAIGDPPNVILVSNKDLCDQGIDFADFTKHLSGGIVFCVIVAYVVLRLLYRNVKIVNDDPQIIEELKREAEIWNKSAERLPVVSAEEKTVKLLLMHKAMQLEQRIRDMKKATSRQNNFQKSLRDLEKKYVIRDRVLLMKSSVVIILVIVLFFIQSFVHGLDLKVGWIAMLGAILLILLADVTHFEDLMKQVEWTTLVFFSALFILMKSLDELGLMEYLGNKSSNLIKDISEHTGDGSCKADRNQLGFAVIVILWVSALVSSFIDNIPFTTAMIPIVLELRKKNTLPLDPLVWALAMGSCLGGNGTLIGASANVVCAGLAEQYGYPITFNKFFKVGFVIMLATTFTAMIYLLISQVLPRECDSMS
ncbi:P protein-like [Porites lutea]|uniref:P protein-like n=1 Tax=Porites lutea TaxID=51062 RepID=UPI003CC66CA8